MSFSIAADLDEVPAVLKKSHAIYVEQTSKILKQSEEERKKANDETASSIKTLEAEYALKGNVEGMLAIKGILDFLQNPDENTITIPEHKNLDELHAIINQREKNLQQLAAGNAKARVELMANYLAHLERLKVQLTTNRELENALLIHNEIQRLTEEQNQFRTIAGEIINDKKKTDSKVETPASPAAPAHPLDLSKILNEQDVVRHLQNLKGSSLTFNAMVQSLASGTISRDAVDLILEGGTRIRIKLPQHTVVVRDLNQVYLRARRSDHDRRCSHICCKRVWQPRNKRIQIKTTISPGVVHHGSPSSFKKVYVIDLDDRDRFWRFWGVD